MCFAQLLFRSVGAYLPNANTQQNALSVDGVHKHHLCASSFFARTPSKARNLNSSAMPNRRWEFASAQIKLQLCARRDTRRGFTYMRGCVKVIKMFVRPFFPIANTQRSGGRRNSSVSTHMMRCTINPSGGPIEYNPFYLFDYVSVFVFLFVCTAQYVFICNMHTPCVVYFSTPLPFIVN